MAGPRRTMNVYFDYTTDSSSEEGKFFVDDNSSLYGLAPANVFPSVQSEKTLKLLLFRSQIAFPNDSAFNRICRNSICHLRFCGRVFRQLKALSESEASSCCVLRSGSLNTGLSETAVRNPEATDSRLSDT